MHRGWLAWCFLHKGMKAAFGFQDARLESSEGKLNVFVVGPSQMRQGKWPVYRVVSC